MAKEFGTAVEETSTVPPKSSLSRAAVRVYLRRSYA